MTNTLLPTIPVPGTALTDPMVVTGAFLARLADSDVPAAMELVADDIVYTNVGLPTVRGRREVERALGSLQAPK